MSIIIFNQKFLAESTQVEAVVEDVNSDDFDSDESDSEEERYFTREEVSFFPKNWLKNEFKDSEYGESSSSLSTTQSSLFEEHEDDDYPTISRVVYLVVKYTEHIVPHKRMIFVQRAFEQFRDLFEKEPKFRKVRNCF